MKRIICISLLVCSLFISGIASAKDAKFHIGVVTGTVSQNEDDLRGAEALIKKYGDVNSGGMIKHITYPD